MMLSTLKEATRTMVKDPNLSPTFKLIIVLIFSFISAISVLFLSIMSSKNQTIDMLKDNNKVLLIQLREEKQNRIHDNNHCDSLVQSLNSMILNRTDQSTNLLLDKLGIENSNKKIIIQPKK